MQLYEPYNPIKHTSEFHLCMECGCAYKGKGFELQIGKNYGIILCPSCARKLKECLDEYLKEG